MDKGEVKIEYFPTQMILVDYFTKPLKEDFQNIQGRHNGLQTHIIVGTNPSSNQGACWK